MRKILLICCFFGLIANSNAQGVLIEDTVVAYFTLPEINDILAQNGLPVGILPTDYEVAVHRVIYTTPDVDGSPTVASGLICLPVDDTCSVPMLAYLHGTKIKKDEAFYHLNGEWHLGVISATSGYAMCLPDYLGLGAGPGIHPYQHAQSQATASVDIMRACRTICQQTGLDLNDQLFLVGYSQGGHAVMATHRMIQEELFDEFTVTASAPGSGAYDLSGSQLEMVASFEPYSVPGYLPFLIQSYQHVYGNLYDSIQQIFVPPYDETLPPLLLGDHYMWEVDAAMPPVPRDIIRPEYAEAFFSDTTHPAYLALKDNDVYEWVPEAPVMYNYCRSDEQVTYMNTLVASEFMINAGAPDIQVIERDSVISHFECATPSILFSKLWFDTMAEMCESSVGVEELANDNDIVVYPNPVTDGVISFNTPIQLQVELFDNAGKTLIAPTTVRQGDVLDVSHLRSSVYLMVITTAEERSVRKLVVQ